MEAQVVIIGASGHGKVIADIIEKSGDKVAGFLDDALNEDDIFCGYRVLGKVPDFPKYLENHVFIIAIGSVEPRERIARELSEKNARIYTAIHPSAQISNLDVKIAQGTVVMANAVINAGTAIGSHCIINSSAVVEHDNTIGDFTHVAVGAKIAGTVQVGKRCWIGIGACVINNINICDKCMIGAGAVVVKSIETPGTYVGIPAKLLK
ncbi:MAG: acetyltransferase [Eubacterium sp.]|nr:acetyltransferase [Eubacterium sp.]